MHRRGGGVASAAVNVYTGRTYNNGHRGWTSLKRNEDAGLQKRVRWRDKKRKDIIKVRERNWFFCHPSADEG